MSNTIFIAPNTGWSKEEYLWNPWSWGQTYFKKGQCC